MELFWHQRLGHMPLHKMKSISALSNIIPSPTGWNGSSRLCAMIIDLCRNMWVVSSEKCATGIVSKIATNINTRCFFILFRRIGRLGNLSLQKEQWDMRWLVPCWSLLIGKRVYYFFNFVENLVLIIEIRVLIIFEYVSSDVRIVTSNVTF